MGGRFAKIVSGDAVGQSADAIRPGYRRLRHRSHMVFFTMDDVSVVIVRVLHVRMDFDSRLGAWLS
jgi:plasmid stabilization system protein ParE